MPAPARIASRTAAGVLTALLGLCGLLLPAAALTIWPVGDSLTSGFTRPGAYRPQLYAHLTNAGITVDLVGSATNDSTASLAAAGETHHDGHSGWFIADTPSGSSDNGKGIHEHVQAWHGGIAEPDVILLMIGTNDLNGGNSVSSAPARFELLLTRLEALSPAARIVVGSVPKASETNTYKNPSVTQLNASIDSFNAKVLQIVTAHADNGRTVEFLDVNAAMTLADLGSDGLHFSQAGYDKLGGVWATAILSSPYRIWAADHAGNGPPDGDHDRDGTPNGVEFFIGEAGATFTRNPGPDASGTVTWPNGGNIPAGDYGSQFSVQTSSSLGGWVDVASTDPLLSNTPSQVSYSLPPGEPAAFVRLSVDPD